MGICISQDFDNRIRRQESYVNREFQSMGGINGNWRNVKMYSGESFSSSQVKGKLRQQYHGRRSNDFISNEKWNRMRR